MFYLFHFVSLLLGEMLGLDLGTGSSVRHLGGANETDCSGAIDPSG
jgi:hypothetical protein